ncbi:hypothetical protein RhiirA5_418897 [Rhizophagus irregularis]|uniref:Uncharacterized protein n=2 Tax=Rhizophagus irregularis TaxID=588596 RepID=A0A2N0PJG6_9GLOM|nr:hypothetical protein RhiirA5_418897 [Rhizophagus irregularis]
MDNHLGIITPYNNLRILSKGYQQGVKFTGAEMRDVMKIIVFVLDELYTIDNGTSCIKLIKCYIKFIKINMIAQQCGNQFLTKMDNRLGTITPYNNLRILSKGYQQEFIKMYKTSKKEKFNESELKSFEYEIIDWTQDFVKLFKNFFPSNLQLPKLHMWRYHTIHTIKRYGSLNGLATDTYETLHKNWVKNPYRMTNKKNVLDQMLKTIRQQEIITNVKKTHVSKLETMKSLLWKLPISDLQAFREKLEHENSVDELCIEGMHHLINCLDAYLDDKSNVTECEDIYLKIYATGVLSNNEIIYATSKFHNNAKFSDIAIAMDNVDYLTDDGLCYGKILMIAEILFLPNYYPIFPIVLVHWYDYYSK